MKRLRQIEIENARLKKLLDKGDLKIEVMKEIAPKNDKRAGSPMAGCVCEALRPSPHPGFPQAPVTPHER